MPQLLSDVCHETICQYPAGTLSGYFGGSSIIIRPEPESPAGFTPRYGGVRSRHVEVMPSREAMRTEESRCRQIFRFP